MLAAENKLQGLVNEEGGWLLAPPPQVSWASSRNASRNQVLHNQIPTNIKRFPAASISPGPETNECRHRLEFENVSLQKGRVSDPERSTWSISCWKGESLWRCTFHSCTGWIRSSPFCSHVSCELVFGNHFVLSWRCLGWLVYLGFFYRLFFSA